MKNNVLTHSALALLIVGLTVSCRDDEQQPANPDPVPPSTENGIPNFFDKNVVLATGIDFQTGKSAVLNPITGEPLNQLINGLKKPCTLDEIIVTSDNSAQQTTQQQPSLLRKTTPRNTTAASTQASGCTTQILNPNQELTSVLHSSDKIISGTIRKDGKDVPARFVTSVTALYEGSMCATYISLGTQYEFCTTTQERCDHVSPVLSPVPGGYTSSTNESYRRAARQVCRQFPAWKTSDCNYLKTRYKTTPTYSNRYKQYIWKTCNVQPTWGPCPPPTSPASASECVMPVVKP